MSTSNQRPAFRPASPAPSSATTAAPTPTAMMMLNTAHTSFGPSIAVRFKYQQEIGQMMYTFGEVRHSPAETTQLIEDIVRQQMIETLIQAAQLARRRGSRYFSHEDLLFLIRRDSLKVARLTAYLSWRKVRKVANRAGGGSSAATTAVAAGGADLVDEDLLMMEDAATGGGGADPVDLLKGSGGASAGQQPVNASSQKNHATRRLKVNLPWNRLDHYSHLLSNVDDDDSDSDGAFSDDEERLYNSEARQRLLYADLLTQKMTNEEYLDYAECRQASFTYKKPSRFREWLNIEQHTGMRPSNDLLDVLGFLCYEMVRTLTEQCLAVKKEMDLNRRVSELSHLGDGAGGQSASGGGTGGNASTATGMDLSNAVGMNGRHNPLLNRINKEFQKEYEKYNMFSSPDERTPIEPVHVHEAFRRLQQNEHTILSEFIPKGTSGSSMLNDSRYALKNFAGGRLRVKLSLI